VNPVPLGSYTGAFGDWVWYMIPRFKFMGADPTLVGQVAHGRKQLAERQLDRGAKRHLLCTEHVL